LDKTENVISENFRFTFMGEYLVKCLGCGAVQPPYALTCQNDDSLLRTEYASKQLNLKRFPGVWKFFDWLPVKEPLKGAGEKPTTYKSKGLAKEFGLNELHISFSGYWPEKGARMATCSFKDLEAPATVQRMIERTDHKTLVVSSAGNTARAFAQAASVADIPLVLVVPPAGLDRLWITEIPSDKICVVSVKGDYTEAIDVGTRLASRPGFVGEGGARNVARRDGMGIVMLDAAVTNKTLPKHYFQAIGSGTGGIAAWEAALRLIEDGRFGNNMPKLHLAQNLPCSPVYTSWSGVEIDGRICPKGMYDDVLFNRKPPYSVKGGVKDALDDTGGIVYGITNEEAKEARKIFEEAEEIDILPAAAIAVAALKKAAESGAVKPNDPILLNITGGGISRVKKECELNMLKFDIETVPSALREDEALLTEINEIMKRRS